jgi:hypothetical protein
VENISWYGCLRALGHKWMLNSQALAPGYDVSLTGVAEAGRFAVLEFNFQDHYDDCSNSVTVYDLSNGKPTPVVSYDCTPGDAYSGTWVDSLSLSASGFSAWRAQNVCSGHNLHRRADLRARRSRHPTARQRSSGLRQPPSPSEPPREPQPLRQRADLDSRRHPTSDHSRINATKSPQQVGSRIALTLPRDDNIGIDNVTVVKLIAPHIAKCQGGRIRPRRGAPWPCQRPARQHLN